MTPCAICHVPHRMSLTAEKRRAYGWETPSGISANSPSTPVTTRLVQLLFRTSLTVIDDHNDDVRRTFTHTHQACPHTCKQTEDTINGPHSVGLQAFPGPWMANSTSRHISENGRNRHFSFGLRFVDQIQSAQWNGKSELLELQLNHVM